MRLQIKYGDMVYIGSAAGYVISNGRDNLGTYVVHTDDGKLNYINSNDFALTKKLFVTLEKK